MSGAFIYGTPNFVDSEPEFSEPENEPDEILFAKNAKTERDSQMTDNNSNLHEEEEEDMELIDLKEERQEEIDPEDAPIVIEQAEDDMLMSNTLIIEEPDDEDEDDVEKIELFYDGPASKIRKQTSAHDILKPIRCSVIKIGPLAKPETDEEDEIEVEEMHIENDISDR